MLDPECGKEKICREKHVIATKWKIQSKRTHQRRSNELRTCRRNCENRAGEGGYETDESQQMAKKRRDVGSAP